MARRIVWTSKADIIFTEILEFYCNRNKSKNYSRKLNRDINTIIQLLPKYPFIGIKTEIDRVRVLIKGNYKVFYEIKPAEIIIHLVWDTRQDPKKFPLKR